MTNNTSYSLSSNTDEPHGASMAWFLPTFVGVFMMIFLLVSWILHHRRFRERYKHRELLEYYLELRVDYGRRRVATPTTSSSMRHKENEVDFNQESPTIVKLVARSSLDPAISIAIKDNDTRVTKSRTKRAKKLSKVTQKDSGFLKLFGISSSKPSTNGKRSEDSEKDGTDLHVASSPILSKSAPIHPQKVKFKDVTNGTQSDTGQNSGRHLKENGVMLLKVSSVPPLDQIIPGEIHLNNAKYEQTSI